MRNETAEILTFESLEIGYGKGFRRKILLPPLSGSAKKNELVALIGRNGIGKSTLLRTIAGLQRPFSGNINVNGNDISRYSRLGLARITGYISTEIIRAYHMTVYDLVSLGRFPHTNWIGTIDDQSRKAIDDAIFKSGLEHLSKRNISELSDGERQRAMIARVLAQDTLLMIMDEPLAFLDMPGKFEIVNLIRSLSERGKTVVFSTHDLGLAIKNADRIWLLQNNGIIEGTPEELIEKDAFDLMFGATASVTDRLSGKQLKDYLKNFL